MPTIHDNDPNFKLLQSIVKHIDRTTIKTGFIEGKTKSRKDTKYVKAGEADNVSVATTHEFGIGVPKRPFMAPSFDKNKDKYENNLEKGITVSLKSKNINTFKTTTKAVGMQMKADVQNEIATGNFKPLSQATIEARANRYVTAKTQAKVRANPKPLNDTGQMRQSVDYFISKE
jgi:hypothetical protein